jgi:O-antigen/teichoic acid export membrane protein
MEVTAPTATAVAVISSAQRRDRRAVWTALASLLSRAISYTVVLLSVPLTFGYLGQGRYGVWVALTGTVSWVLLLDFGLGSTLRQRLGAAAAFGDGKRAQAEVSTIFALLCALAVVLGVGFAAALPLVPWEGAFNAPEAMPPGELRWVVAIIGGLMLIRLPLLVTGAVYQAYQRGWIPAVWDAVASVASFGALVVVTRQRWGLPALALAVAGAALAGNIVSTIHLFARSNPWLRPRLANVKAAAVGPVLRLGASFMVLQVAALLLHQTDTIIIAHVLGPQAVAEYDIAYRPFWIVLSIQGVCLAPLLAAYGEAYVTGDLTWIRSRLRLTAGLSLAAGILAAAILVTRGATILTAWVGTAVPIDTPLLAALSMWTLLYLWTSCFSGFLVGIGSVSLMGWIAILSAPVNILLCIQFAKWFGLAGVAAANIATLLVGSVPATIEAFLRLRQAEART